MTRTEHERKCGPRVSGMTSNVVSLASLATLLAAFATPTVACAQSPAPASATTLSIDAGSESENYLRYLQALGEVPLSQWSIRSFGPREVDSLLSKPASVTALRSFEHPVRDAARLRWQVEPLTVHGWYETRFPF